MIAKASRLAAGIGALAILLGGSAISKEPKELLTSELAVAFGSAPVIQGSKLSPDGNRVSSIMTHPSGVTVLSVTDIAARSSTSLMASEKDEFDIAWCDWANDTYLLCGLRLMEAFDRQYIPTTRLVSISAETAEMRELVDRDFENDFQQYQDRVIDWMPDDPEHVLIERPFGSGYGVGRINILTGTVTTAEAGRDRVFRWITDGHGTPRLHRQTFSERERWYVRDTPEADWRLLHERALTDLGEEFNPIGFGDNRNELLYYDRHEGRWAMFAMDLQDADATRLVYSNPGYDVGGVQSLGKYSRIVAASFASDRAYLHYFDTRLERIHRQMSETFPEKLIDILDEDWNQRFYLLFVSSAEDPGAYYRYDSQEGELLLLARAYPLLEGRELIPMSPIEYQSEDGAWIPSYLTMPQQEGGARKAVILPHGGPSSRDYWNYDFLAQFLAANGYAVLQSNYRGSSGYGEGWQGEGGFRNWRQTVADVHAGFDYLVNEGIADADRICAVGWSYGAYAALMSVIEHPDDYRCVVSIAGVTDPRALAEHNSRFVGGLSAREFIGDEDEVIKEGSPVERADEIVVPVLIVHGAKDPTVPFLQGDVLQRALRKGSAGSELIEYEHADHSITKERYRTDLLARLAQFLDQNTALAR